MTRWPVALAALALLGVARGAHAQSNAPRRAPSWRRADVRVSAGIHWVAGGSTAYGSLPLWGFEGYRVVVLGGVEFGYRPLRALRVGMSGGYGETSAGSAFFDRAPLGTSLVAIGVHATYEGEDGGSAPATADLADVGGPVVTSGSGRARYGVRVDLALLVANTSLRQEVTTTPGVRFGIGPTLGTTLGPFVFSAVAPSFDLFHWSLSGTAEVTLVSLGATAALGGEW